ncbi:MAG TPA: plasma-membrane proton-efflux P-type ATPase [Actinomycetota bacterium]|nr:plasma-membrane proton-efflux P-type ATPase [Actinomycetota bacterium]
MSGTQVARSFAAPPFEGLASAEAARRLAEVGPNAVEERAEPALVRLARRFWGPLPWMLEVTIVATFALGKATEAVIITGLLVVNGLLGFRQSARADRALQALKSRLAVTARAHRDGAWRRVPARELVPGDLVRIRTGDIVPADLEVLEGSVSLDQSSLTGESLPEDVHAGGVALGSSLVQRGEVTARVTATGPASYLGRAARLVQESRAPTALERAVFTIIRYLVAIDATLVAVMVVYALATGTPLGQVAPFALIVLIASVPVALPTTFSAAQAVGAQELSREHGVLVRRLAAVQEAASMDVLCTDKTGTLTLNRLRLAAAEPGPGFDRDALLELAALASDSAGQDPIDLAILAAAAGTPGTPGTQAASGWRRVAFQPFDPSTKRTEATVDRDGPHGLEREVVVKGMPQVVAGLCATPPEGLDAAVERLAVMGCRVLAVAAGPAGALEFAGLLGLADPPRPDARALVDQLHALGVAVKMVTGDTAATAMAVARAVGIRGPVITGADIRANPGRARSAAVVAAVYPEDKHAVVAALQEAGHTVGMTGDGVNDAPALRRAEVGVAVEGAVDVARAAASMVLTDPGLVDLVEAVRVSRSIHQRMLTWVLNKIVKTAQVSVFLTVGFFLTHRMVTTPLDIVLLLFANDFVTMSLAVDRVRPSAWPDRWRAGALTAAALVLALGVAGQSFLDLALARGAFHLDWGQTQTLMFVMLVVTGQATVYLVRERGRLWASRPAGLLLAATVGDLLAVGLVARLGILMPAVGLGPMLAVLGIAVASMLALDPVKVRVLRRLGLG